MFLRKHEVHNNTDEQAATYVRKALALVDELEPAEDLRVAVFTQAVNLYSGKQLVVEQTAVSPNGLSVPR